MVDATQLPPMSGRPNGYSLEIAAVICERLIEGESLRSICREETMPAASTVFLWLTLQPEFSEQYARAREAQADSYADEIVEIADDGRRDYDKDGLVDHDHIARSRLRVDARKWIASKLKPKKYGEKLDTTLAGPEGGPIAIVAGISADDAAKAYFKLITGT